MEKGSYYLGLDIGTNSVGWAVSDKNYNLNSFNNKKMWGVRLFEEAKTAEDRRIHRQARRRRQRQIERLNLLMEIFDEEVSKIDDSFFIRKNESDLHIEDKALASKYSIFNDKNFTDREYYKKYPTIFHLIMDLIENNDKKDIRLVYLACHYLIKNRGHFIFEGQKFDSSVSFDKSLEDLKKYLDVNYDIVIEFENNKIAEILKNPENGINKKQELLKGYFGKSKLEKGVIKLISGGIQNLSIMFDDKDLKNSDFEKLDFSSSKFDEETEGYANELGERINLILILKKIYDVSILETMMSESTISSDGNKYLSSAKINLYNKHKNDLKKLKYIIKKYNKQEYNNIFRKDTKAEKGNYVSYVKSNISKNKRSKADVYVTKDDFYSYIKNKLSKIKDLEAKKEISCIEDEMKAGIFMPKLRTTDNSVIPYQLKEMELRKILENQSKYYDFLNKKDPSGLSNIEKIISLLTFRLPYYIGPVNPSYNQKNNYNTSWVKRIARGKVTPWNLENKIDVEETRKRFIENKINKCTYLLDEFVLPKNSLLYEEYMVLNELNNMKINGEDIDTELKSAIYNELFKKYKKVSLKKVINFIKEKLNIIDDIIITGVDGDIKHNLKSYVTFKTIVGEKIDDDRYKSEIEEIIKISTLYGDDKEYIKKRLNHDFKDKFTKDELKEILKLKFNDWARLSEKVLIGICGTNKQTGEVDNIINFLRKTNMNLMQLMSNKFTFSEQIQKNNSKYYKYEKLNYNMVNDLYLSPSVKRMLWQSLSIVEEIKKIKKKDPEKIFIEMARGKEDIPQRKESRKNNLKTLYKSCKKEFIEIIGKDEFEKIYKDIEKREAKDFRWDDLFLYYTQLGRCMYSLDPIDISELGRNNIYDQDHIYPKSKLYDDSIENRVLVKKQLNELKGNKYPIDSNIVKNRSKVEKFWKLLFDRGLIGEKKYSRLIRKTPFTDQELGGFIERQLVETRQATKETANLLKILCPESKIVYVKAKNVSIFRNKFDIVKNRNVNNLHHAHDAYLNIVVGNIFYTKFTTNPYMYIKSNEINKNYNLEKIYEYDVKRGNDIAWIGENSDQGLNSSIINVKRNIRIKDIRVTRRTHIQKGNLFDLTIQRKGKGQSPIKENSKKSDIKKYGGYNKVSISYFCLVKDKDGKKTLEAIPIKIKNKIENNEQKVLKNYLEENLKIKNPEILLDNIKINSLIKISGFKYYLKGKTNNNLKIDGAIELILDEKYEKYFKRIEKVTNRLSENKEYKINKFDQITRKENIEIFDVFVEKLKNSIYRFRVNNKAKDIISNRDKFIELSVENQVILLNQILLIFGSRNNGVNLQLLELPKQSCVSLISKKINTKEYKIINQSITGLFETEKDLLKL